MIPFAIIKKKEPAIKLRDSYFYSYDTFYNNKQKGTNNKVLLETFSFPGYFLQ